MMYSSIASLTFLVIAVIGDFSFLQERPNVNDSSADDIQKIQENVRNNPPVKYREVIMHRKLARRKLQQNSYTALLYDTVKRDGAGALISYFKMKVQVEFSLEHGMIFWIIPPDPVFNIPGVPFEEDTGFPEDPWKE